MLTSFHFGPAARLGNRCCIVNTKKKTNSPAPLCSPTSPSIPILVPRWKWAHSVGGRRGWGSKWVMPSSPAKAEPRPEVHGAFCSALFTADTSSISWEAGSWLVTWRYSHWAGHWEKEDNDPFLHVAPVTHLPAFDEQKLCPRDNPKEMIS